MTPTMGFWIYAVLALTFAVLSIQGAYLHDAPQMVAGYVLAMGAAIATVRARAQLDFKKSIRGDQEP
jgi:hypothetical protein